MSASGGGLRGADCFWARRELLTAWAAAEANLNHFTATMCPELPSLCTQGCPEHMTDENLKARASRRVMQYCIYLGGATCPSHDFDLILTFACSVVAEKKGQKLAGLAIRSTWSRCWARYYLEYLKPTQAVFVSFEVRFAHATHLCQLDLTTVWCPRNVVN